jgi:hypothetical protein
MNVSADVVEAFRLASDANTENLASVAQQVGQRCDNEFMETPDYRSAQDYEKAIEILTHVQFSTPQRRDDIVGPVGMAWRERAAAHLHAKLDRYFRDRIPLRSEQVALAEIKRIALVVRDASEALLACAERMKSKGDRTGAADAFRAYQRFRDEARALLGGEA